jgi:hypothetical protein
LDDDEGMARSALINFLSWSGLTAEQYKNLIGHSAFDFPVAQKLIWRNRMYVELLKDESADEVFAEMIEKHDATFERELVEAESISCAQLQLFRGKRQQPRGSQYGESSIAKAKIVVFLSRKTKRRVLAFEYSPLFVIQE